MQAFERPRSCGQPKHKWGNEIHGLGRTPLLPETGSLSDSDSFSKKRD